MRVVMSLNEMSKMQIDSINSCEWERTVQQFSFGFPLSGFVFVRLIQKGWLNAHFLQLFNQLSTFVHVHQDVTPTNKITTHEDLWYCRPFCVLLYSWNRKRLNLRVTEFCYYYWLPKLKAKPCNQHFCHLKFIDPISEIKKIFWSCAGWKKISKRTGTQWA